MILRTRDKSVLLLQAIILYISLLLLIEDNEIQRKNYPRSLTKLFSRGKEEFPRRRPRSALFIFARNSGAKLDATSGSIFPTRHATTLNSVHSFPSIRIPVCNINDKLPVFRPPARLAGLRQMRKFSSKSQFASRTFHPPPRVQSWIPRDQSFAACPAPAPS